MFLNYISSRYCITILFTAQVLTAFSIPHRHGQDNHPASHHVKNCKNEICDDSPLEFSEPVQGVRPVLACPPGYELNGTTCVNSIEFDAHYECEQGHRHHNRETCFYVQVVDAELECPKSGRLGHNSMCEVTEIEEPIISCPHGFMESLNGNECFKNITEHPSLKCPNGYRLKKDTCVRDTAEPSIPACKAPFELVETEAGHFECLAIEYEEPKLVCPHGHILEGNICMFRKVQVPTITCPVGFIWYNGACWLEDAEIDAEAICEGGKLLEDWEWCIETKSADAQVRCPHLYEFQNGQCIRLSHKHPKDNCPKGYNIFELDIGIGVADGSSKICRRINSYHPRINCPEGTLHKKPLRNLGQHTCYFPQISSPKRSCHDGFILSNDGNECIGEFFYPAKLDCGFDAKLVDGICQKEERTPANYTCNEANEIQDGFLCQMIERKSPQIRCHEKMHHKDGYCISEEFIPMEPYCGSPPREDRKIGEANPGFVGRNSLWGRLLLQKHKVHMARGMCVEESRIEPEIVCPKDGIMHAGKCVIYIDAGPAGLGCRAEYTLNDQLMQCEKRESISALLTCNSGYDLDHDKKRCRSRSIRHGHGD